VTALLRSGEVRLDATGASRAAVCCSAASAGAAAAINMGSAEAARRKLRTVFCRETLIADPACCWRCPDRDRMRV